MSIIFVNRNLLTLLKESIGVYCERHKYHKSVLYGQNAGFFIVRAGGTCGNHCVWKGNGPLLNWKCYVTMMTYHICKSAYLCWRMYPEYAWSIFVQHAGIHVQDLVVKITQTLQCKIWCAIYLILIWFSPCLKCEFYLQNYCVSCT